MTVGPKRVFPALAALSDDQRLRRELDPEPLAHADADARRDHTTICVVERPIGAIAIEKSGNFRGVFHVLNGVLNPLEGVGPAELRLDRLTRRVQQGEVKEVIVATNATAEGEATALYLAKILAPLGVSITRIAHGVPMGGGLEFADDATLSHALQGRTRL